MSCIVRHADRGQRVMAEFRASIKVSSNDVDSDEITRRSADDRKRGVLDGWR